MARVRSNTKYSFYVGAMLVVATLATIAAGFYTGAVSEANIVEIIYALLIGVSTMFGLNLHRVAKENVASINAATDIAENPPIEDTTLIADTNSIEIAGPPIERKF